MPSATSRRCAAFSVVSLPEDESIQCQEMNNMIDPKPQRPLEMVGCAVLGCQIRLLGDSLVFLVIQNFQANFLANSLIAASLEVAFVFL